MLFGGAAAQAAERSLQGSVDDLDEWRMPADK